jgi:hypothetical protein
MYQPYPTSGGQPPEPQRPPLPNSVQNAVKLMYAGAGLTAIELIVYLATISSLRNAIHKAFPTYSATRVHQVEVSSIIFTLVILLIAIGLWIWMARASAAGRNYARITGTVFFGLNTLNVLLQLARPHASVALVVILLVWLAGLGAVIMLWRRESGEYFSRRTQ